MYFQTIFFKISVLCSILMILPIKSQGQNVQHKDSEALVIPRIASPIKLDGKSDEKAWQEIEPFPMTMTNPHFGDEPSHPTEILMCYDDDYIYIAGRFHYKNASHIQAASFLRDFWYWSSDFITITLDTFNDNENGVVFITTPVGSRTDANILNDADGAPYRNVNISWDTFWDVESVCIDNVWFSEMRIPFSSLRFEEKNGQVVMGLTASRYSAHTSESCRFPLIPQRYYFGNYKPSQTTDILFKGIRRHNPLYITPYILAGLGKDYKLNNSATAYHSMEKSIGDIGLDVRYGLTNNLTLNATLNTDFAQVEADNQTINLTRYSLFFPEKRLFFQERSGNFDFRFESYNRLFHSRRIGIHGGEQVRIYGGARVVGRVGQWDVGLLNMQTEKTAGLPSENFNVFRLRKQVFNPYSYIGGMLTSRIGLDGTWNTAYGLDGIFRLNEEGDDYLTLKWAQSFENDNINDPGSLDPSKIYVNFSRRSEQALGFNLSYSRSGSDFNPGIGFERRHNYTRFANLLQYGWFPGKNHPLQHHKIFAEGYMYTRNSDGTVESMQWGPGWEFETKGNSYGAIEILHYQEDVRTDFSFSDDAHVPAGNYTFYGIEAAYAPHRGRSYRLETYLDAGSFYDGRRLSMSFYPTADLSAHLQLEGMYQFNRLEFPNRNQTFTGHVARLRALAFLNVKHSFIAFVQYNSANHLIISNVRYRYNPRQGNDFYIVYDEGLNMDRERQVPVLPRVKNRTVLLKYTYTFDM